MVGGTTLCFSARAHMIPSVAPTAPKEWPVMDFVPDTRACGTTLAIAPVSGRGSGSVGVDVTHVLGADASVREGGDHGAFHAAALFVGGCDVIGVGRAAVACHRGDGLGAAALGVFLALQDYRPCAFAHNEAVAAFIEGTTRAGGLFVAAAHRTDRAESGHGEGCDRGLRGAGDHHVGVTAPDQLESFGNSFAARGAGQHRTLARARGAERDRQLTRCHVRDHHGDQKRANPSGPALVQDPVLPLPGRDAPDAAAHHYGDPLGRLAHEVHYPRALSRLYACGYA